MAGWTNRGKYMMLGSYFRAGATPTNFFVALVTSAAAPTQDTNTLSELTEIANGNGYSTGGYSLARNSTDFDVLTEDDSADVAYAQVKDVVWTASAGNLPASGNGARYALIIDDNATVGSRQVVGYFSLTSDRTVSVGQTLTLQNLEMRLTE